MKTKTEAKETTKDEVNVKKKKRLTRESIEQTLDQPPGPYGEEVKRSFEVPSDPRESRDTGAGKLVQNFRRRG